MMSILFLFPATTDDGKKIHLLVKIKQYMERAEKLKCLIEEQKEGMFASDMHALDSM